MASSSVTVRRFSISSTRRKLAHLRRDPPKLVLFWRATARCRLPPTLRALCLIRFGIELTPAPPLGLNEDLDRLRDSGTMWPMGWCYRRRLRMTRGVCFKLCKTGITSIFVGFATRTSEGEQDRYRESAGFIGETPLIGARRFERDAALTIE
jgi:hypothetical protein